MIIGIQADVDRQKAIILWWPPVKWNRQDFLE